MMPQQMVLLTFHKHTTRVFQQLSDTTMPQEGMEVDVCTTV